MIKEVDIIKVFEDTDIKKYINSKVENDYDREDILQSSIEKLLKVLKNEPNKEIKNLKNYFFFIVKNKITDYYRSRKGHCELDENVIGENIENYEELICMLSDYPILNDMYVKGYSFDEMLSKYGVQKSRLYEMLKEEKVKLRSELYE